MPSRTRRAAIALAIGVLPFTLTGCPHGDDDVPENGAPVSPGEGPGQGAPEVSPDEATPGATPQPGDAVTPGPGEVGGEDVP